MEPNRKQHAQTSPQLAAQNEPDAVWVRHLISDLELSADRHGLGRGITLLRWAATRGSLLRLTAGLLVLVSFWYLLVELLKFVE